MTGAVFVAVALATFAGARWLQRWRPGLVLANPTLAAMVALALLAYAMGLSPAQQQAAGRALGWGLDLAIVALAVPLWEMRRRLRGLGRALALGLVVGVAVGVGSALALGWAVGLPPELVAPLAVKTFSSPFLVAALPPAGADAALPAALSVLSGVVGALALPALTGKRATPAERGLATGVAAHLVGTARLAALDARAAAWSALATVAMGLMFAAAVALLLALGLA